MVNKIEFHNVSKIYGSSFLKEKEVLKDVNLTIHQGEFIAVMGMNGSGKSTLVRLINGLIRPTTGQVLVNGMDTKDRHLLMDIRRHVGMVFQNPDHQIISSIVEEDVAFGPENLGLSADEVKSRVDWALHVVQLEDRRGYAPHLLSGGQKQRVAIASALAMRPMYLILDEPTSMLDPRGKQELLYHLKILNKEYGITIILISHHMEEVSEANRILILDSGTIYLDLEPRSVFSKGDELARLGLQTPDIVQLMGNLRKRGYDIDPKIVTSSQLVDWLCQ